jgi:hypothetical protein
MRLNLRLVAGGPDRDRTGYLRHAMAVRRDSLTCEVARKRPLTCEFPFSLVLTVSGCFSVSRGLAAACRTLVQVCEGQMPQPRAPPLRADKPRLQANDSTKGTTMAQVTLDQTDIDRIEEFRRQFDPAEHLATAGLLEDLRFEEREAALQFMREAIRDELYGGVIWRAALKAVADHRVAIEDVSHQKVDDTWNDRYITDEDGQRMLRHSNWGHNLGYISGEWWGFMRSVPAEHGIPLSKALWVLLDLAVVAMFGPIGNNYDEPTLEEV